MNLNKTGVSQENEAEMDINKLKSFCVFEQFPMKRADINHIGLLSE